MEYFELIRTIEFDIEVASYIKTMRAELLKSNINANKYRAKILEASDYNLYPSAMNSGPKGEDLQQCHSADRVWRELPISSMELYTGFTAQNDKEAIDKAIHEASNACSSA